MLHPAKGIIQQTNRQEFTFHSLSVVCKREIYLGGDSGTVRHLQSGMKLNRTCLGKTSQSLHVTGCHRKTQIIQTKARKSSGYNLQRDFKQWRGLFSIFQGNCLKDSSLNFGLSLPENYLVLHSSKHGLMSMKMFSPSNSASFPFQPLFGAQSIVSSWDQSSVLNFNTAWEKAAH